MNNPLTSLSDTAKGILLMIGGALLLFNTLGILERGVHLLILIGAVVMIIVGALMSQLPAKISHLINKKQQD